MINKKLFVELTVFSSSKVLVEDIFGEPAREREVDKISTKLPEARSTKSFESFEIVAKKISASQIMVIMTPLKQVGCARHMKWMKSLTCLNLSKQAVVSSVWYSI